MKPSFTDLAPQIYRQRLVIEGLYTTSVTKPALKDFMQKLSEKLEMTIVYGPIVKDLASKINPFHGGLEAVLIWVESGASVYTWERHHFFTVDVYSCKKFDVESTLLFTKEFFSASEIAHKSV